MTLSRTWAIALAGLEGRLVEVECDIAAGLPGLSFTGLPDTAVTESRERIRAAVVNSGADWPNRRITVALLPADLRKVGSRFDLAVVVAVLAAAGQVPVDAVADTVWIAELGLDGRLRPVRGILAAVLAARDQGIRRVVVPAANAGEAALVDGVDVRAAGHLAEVLAALTGAADPLPRARRQPAGDGHRPGAADPLDLAEVVGQPAGRRALEIAAAGGHHLSLVGTPGAGKTMLAERLPGILPPLDEAAALEVTAVHSLAGRFEAADVLITRAPFEAPHHTSTPASLVGGGSHLARPGAISLAHRGVLFLDEAPEFDARALEALRQPLETGEIVLHRSGGAVRYPARFQLVIAANPCGCGSRARDCVCPPAARRRYVQRLSGPLLDRIDLRVEVEPVTHAALVAGGDRGETSAVVAARVAAARGAAAGRWRATGWRSNAEVPGPFLRGPQWRLPRQVVAPAERFLERGLLSARGFDRILRLAWTVADLAGRERPSSEDVDEALYFRTGQVDSWAA